MTYARARLWTGIFGVGLIVTLAVAALAGGWAAELERRAAGSDFVPLLGLAVGISVLLLPVEWIGGHVLQRRFGRSQQTARTFFSRWSRAALLQSLLLAGSAYLILYFGRLGGLWASAAVMASIMTALIIFQGGLARLVGGLRRGFPFDLPAESTASNLESVAATDASFTGGVVGWPGRDRIVIPQGWRKLLGPRGFEAFVARRRLVLEKGWRRQGLWLALAFNLSGFLLCSLLPGAGVTSLSGLVTLNLWLTLWSFVGLLLLPVLSRSAVFAADAALLQEGFSKDLLRENLDRLEPLLDDEPSRSAASESIFHPIPSSQRRLQADGGTPLPKWVPWHAARNALYLSWAGFGFLARAVHCNSGRPELWVMLPCD